MSAVHVFSKHCEKRRNCSLRAISPFPTVFSTSLESFLQFSTNLKLSSANSFRLEESKICRLEKDSVKKNNPRAVGGQHDRLFSPGQFLKNEVGKTLTRNMNQTRALHEGANAWLRGA